MSDNIKIGQKTEMSQETKMNADTKISPNSEQRRAELLRAFAAEDANEAAIEARMAASAVQANDLRDARQRLARAIGLAVEGTSTLVMLGTQAKEKAASDAATPTDNAA